jgi:heme O synthase-like polyprenyltransferase
MAAIIVFSIIAAAVAAFSVAVWFDVDFDSRFERDRTRPLRRPGKAKPAQREGA